MKDLLILLHGFPDGRGCWSKQLAPLSERFDVVAPDQRGYGDSPRPERIDDYRIELLVGDVLALIRSHGREKARIVGHDWGAAVAWQLALTHPEAVERLAVINVPHPQVFARFLKRDPGQMLRSSYIALFQLPWLPERLLSLLGFGKPADLTPKLNWYRAAARHPPARPGDPRVHVPTCVIWGARDPYLKAAMAAPSAALCDDAELHLVENAGHWPQKDEPETVSRLLLDFLTKPQ